MKLIVDKLPSGCAGCLFYSGMYCPLLKKPAPDSAASRLRGCPLTMKFPPMTQAYVCSIGNEKLWLRMSTYVSDTVLNGRALLRTVNNDSPAGWIPM